MALTPEQSDAGTVQDLYDLSEKFAAMIDPNCMEMAERLSAAASALAQLEIAQRTAAYDKAKSELDGEIVKVKEAIQEVRDAAQVFTIAEKVLKIAGNVLKIGATLGMA
jgi:hypothetical protein